MLSLWLIDGLFKTDHYITSVWTQLFFPPGFFNNFTFPPISIQRWKYIPSLIKAREYLGLYERQISGWIKNTDVESNPGSTTFSVCELKQVA